MAVLEILEFGNDILRQKSEEVTVFNEDLWTLLDDMAETMYEAGGVGLAAPQVGVLKRVVVIDVDDDHGLLELINPVITSIRGKQHELEGCLSYPGKNGYVERPAKVRIKAQNRYGKWKTYVGTELLARAFCHETDHLNGILFADKVDVWEKHEDKYKG